VDNADEYVSAHPHWTSAGGDPGSRYRRLFAPDRGRRREHPPTPQVSPRRRDRPEDCQRSRSLGQDHRHRVGSSNSAALSMHYAVLSRWS